MSRADAIAAKQPDLHVRLMLYDDASGGPEQRMSAGWGCICFNRRDAKSSLGFIGWPQLGDKDIGAGEVRNVGYVFLSGTKAADFFRETGALYLRASGSLIGEALIIED